MISLLGPAALRKDVRAACEKAVEGLVVVPPIWVAEAAELTGEKPVQVGTAVGWPWGFASAQAKAVEAATAAADGAEVLWLVPNRSALASGADLIVLDEIQAVLDLAESAGAEVHVVIEDGLAPRDRGRLVQMADECGAAGLVVGEDFTDEVLESLRELTDLPVTHL
jgi:deoxyribose-phosphate aldolase